MFSKNQIKNKPILSTHARQGGLKTHVRQGDLKFYVRQGGLKNSCVAFATHLSVIS